MKNNIGMLFKNLVLAILGICGFFLPSQHCLPQWSADSYFNNAICTAPANQGPVMIVSDGSGGAIILFAVWSHPVKARPTADYKPCRHSKNGAISSHWNLAQLLFLHLEIIVRT